LRSKTDLEDSLFGSVTGSKRKEQLFAPGENPGFLKYKKDMLLKVRLQRKKIKQHDKTTISKK
jgi:hypothetical protein